MARLTEDQKQLRARVAAWMRFYFERYRHEDVTKKNFAMRLHLADATVINIMNNKRGAGIDALVAMRDYVGADIIQVIDTDPPKERSGERTTNPTQASPSNAFPGRPAKTGRV